MEKLTKLFEAQDDAIKLLNFPITRQATEWSCGAAVVQTSLEYYGMDNKEMDLVKFLGANEEKGTKVERMIKLLNMNGLQTDVRDNMNINDIIYYIDKDIPVIIVMQAWGNTDDYSEEWNHGHYATAIGYSRNKILFSDPSMFNIGYLGYGELMKRWHDRDDDKKYTRLGIAVYGKTAKFDVNKFVHIG
jgi:predicted double-glycine peptidase